MPLTAYQTLAAFKLFLADVGLLSAMTGLDSRTLIDGNRIFEEFKGTLTEQFVMQQLRHLRSDYVGYWANEKNTSEVDFLLQNAKHAKDATGLMELPFPRLRHRTGDGLRERLSARCGRGLLFDGVSDPVAASSGRAGVAPARPEKALSLCLPHPACLCYLLSHESAPSGRSQRAGARAARKAISYHFTH